MRLPTVEISSRVSGIKTESFIESCLCFNAFRDGGYLEMARPGVPAFIDGRVQAVPDEAWRALQEADESSAAFQAYIEEVGCEWAIATRRRERIGGWRRLNGSSNARAFRCWVLCHFWTTWALRRRTPPALGPGRRSRRRVSWRSGW